MTSPTPAKPVSPRCSECGVLFDNAAKTCWMCGVEREIPSSGAEPPVQSLAKSEQDLLLDMSFWLLLMLAVAVTYGVFFVDQDQLIFEFFQIAYAFAVLPPLVVGICIATYYRIHERPLSWLNKTLLVLIISAISFPLASTVFAYLFVIALLQECFPSR